MKRNGLPIRRPPGFPVDVQADKQVRLSTDRKDKRASEAPNGKSSGSNIPKVKTRRDDSRMRLWSRIHTYIYTYVYLHIYVYNKRLFIFWNISCVQTSRTCDMLDSILTIHHLPDRQLSDNGQVVKDVFIYLLAGVAVLIGILLITFLSTVLVDYISKPPVDVPSRFDQHDAALAAAAAAAAQQHVPVDGRSIEDYDRGSISRQANLWGLQTAERELILQKIFPTMSFEYNANELPTDIPVNRQEDGHVSTPVVPTDIEMANMSATTKSVTNDTVADTTVTAVNEGTMGVDLPIQDDTDHYRMCCICLSPYENGVRVMTGVQCQHMFHDACCQQWLLKHDHCPYCRKNMILATDFRNVAIQTLRPDRIAELSVIPIAAQRPTQPPT